MCLMSTILCHIVMLSCSEKQNLSPGMCKERQHTLDAKHIAPLNDRLNPVTRHHFKGLHFTFLRG